MPNNQLESKVIQICCEPGVEVNHNDIDGCHRLPLSRYNRFDNKKVVAKFVNRKHSETLLYKKKSLSNRDFSYINIPSKIFVLVLLCPYYHFVWSKCKNFQKKGKRFRYFVSMEQFHLNFPTVGVLYKLFIFPLFMTKKNRLYIFFL